VLCCAVLCCAVLCPCPSGATLYLEPSELLELNNREAQLADEETQAELAVLQVRGDRGERAVHACVCACVRVCVCGGRGKVCVSPGGKRGRVVAQRCQLHASKGYSRRASVSMFVSMCVSVGVIIIDPKPILPYIEKCW